MRHCAKIYPLILMLLGSGCSSEAPEKAAGVTEADAPPEPVTVVSGWIDLSDFPELDESIVEVLLVDSLEESVPDMLLRQNKVLRDHLRPPAKEDAQDNGDDDEGDLLSKEDREALIQQLESLRERIPEPFESTFTGENRSWTFKSSGSLYERYRESFKGLNLNNLVESLNRISAQMQEDYEALNETVQSGEGTPALQARADINWLAILSEHMSEYATLVRRYDSLLRRALMMQRREAMRERRSGGQSPAAPADPWLAYHVEDGERMLLVFYRDAVDSSFAAEDGSFELTGDGKVVAGIEVDGRTVFFVEGYNEDAPVRLRELSRRIVKR